MKKYVLIIILLFSFVIPVEAQNPQPIKHLGFPPPRDIRPKKYRKDTTKFNPYTQDTLLHSIPFNRVYIHDKIEKEQKRADLSDGKIDTFIQFLTDTSVSALLSKSVFKDISRYKLLIENMPIAGGRDSLSENQHKIRCLTAIWELLRRYNGDSKIEPYFYINLIANMRGMLIASNENKLLEFAHSNSNLYTLDNSKLLMENAPDARAYIYAYMGKENPKMMIRRLAEFATDTFAGKIISADALIEPELIFNYATSTNAAYKNAIHRTKDPLVQAIARIADVSKAPLKALPFLSDIVSGRKSISEIDAITDNIDDFYKNLVRLKIQNDSIAENVYTKELAYRGIKNYVREMNELHESKDNIRFKCIDSLSSIDLYYLIVNGQDEIYTSSYLGTFKRLIERMKPVKGDLFLDTLHYDRFRTFIRMAANYNTLPDFLNTIEDTNRTKLLSKFIAGLQNGREDELEDAVDVADAFGSIKDSALSAFLQAKVKVNYELSYSQQSKKGMIIYSLLSRLFEGNKISGTDTGSVVASERLHLPPINKVPIKTLINDSGIVYEQVYFFGDEDGEKAYDGFIDGFKKDKNWQIKTTEYWSEIISVNGKKIVIYANLPLKEPDDENAQERLVNHLNDSNIKPTIVIHRGHSYHLPLTLSKLNKYVKIVVLGSCGGYHNLAVVLDHSPDAHIISSKQTGVMAVNEPIIKAINTTLLDGADIDWIKIWNELDDYFAKKPELQEKFADYIPPYKNLGALFIKAYRRILLDSK